jgi:hypothetical protein
MTAADLDWLAEWDRADRDYGVLGPDDCDTDPPAPAHGSDDDDRD